MKFCTNCKYSKPLFYDGMICSYECTHSEAIDDISLITGYQTHHDASEMRLRGSCGRIASLYEPSLIRRLTNWLKITKD